MFVFNLMKLNIVNNSYYFLSFCFALVRYCQFTYIIFQEPKKKQPSGIDSSKVNCNNFESFHQTI